MVHRKYIFLFIVMGMFFSCLDDDLPDTADPNLFLGVWKLESATRNSIAQNLTDCNKESTLNLFWFSEDDPVYNAEIYTYEINEDGECMIAQQILNAEWIPLRVFDAEGGATAQVPLRYTVGGTFVSLELTIENDLLLVQGEVPINGEMIAISETYRQLRQEL